MRSRRRIGLLLLVGILSLMGIVIPAHRASAWTWQLYPCKWSTNGVSYDDYSGGSTDHQAIEAAASLWTQTPTPIYYYAQSGNDDEIMNDGMFGLNGYSGWTTWNCSNSRYTAGMSTWINASYTINYPYYEIVSVASHELGHVLGLGHNDSWTSCSNMALMYHSDYRYTQCGIYWPQSDDVNGINTIY